MNISPARTAAFDILLRIETDKAFSSVLLPMFEERLTSNDASLCHELTFGVLRRRLYLDRVIDTLAGGKKLDLEVRMALRLGLYQIICLSRVPAYSAINESVNLAVRARKTSAKGLVNAILRRSTRDVPELKFTDDIDRLSVEASHPRWLVEKWMADFGPDDAASLAAANNQIPNTAFRVLGRATEDSQRLIENSRESKHVADCFIAETAGDAFDLAQSGEIYIQDEASQMVAHAVAAKAGGYILDLCAAPGGKTGLIALKNTGNFLVAGELHCARVDFLKENCRRQGVSRIATVQLNAEHALPFREGSFDAVLVDAPCSGTGTIRRNPEIRYSIQPSDFADLAAKQLAILIEASKLVVAGGSLIYATCSLEREENEDVFGRFLTGSPDYRAVQPNVPRSFLTVGGFGRTLPHRDGMDGFFIAAARRN